MRHELQAASKHHPFLERFRFRHSKDMMCGDPRMDDDDGLNWEKSQPPLLVDNLTHLSVLLYFKNEYF